MMLNLKTQSAKWIQVATEHKVLRYCTPRVYENNVIVFKEDNQGIRFMEIFDITEY